MLVLLMHPRWLQLGRWVGGGPKQYKYNSNTVNRSSLKFTVFWWELSTTADEENYISSWKQLSCWLSPAEKANFTTTLPTTTYMYRVHTQTGKRTGQFLVDGFGDPYSGWDYGCRKRKNSPIKPSPTSHRALIINGSALSPKSFIYPWTGSSSKSLQPQDSCCN